MEWALSTYDEPAVRDAQAIVDVDEPWAMIERFASLIRESGSEDERHAAEYIRERLESFGLHPQVHEPELYLSVPRASTLDVLEPEPEQVDSKTPAFSASTGDAPAEGKLVAVSTTHARRTSDLFTATAAVDSGEVAGNIVLANGYAMPKIVGQIEAAGAAAAIFINPGNSHEGIVTSIWGIPGLTDRDRIPNMVVVCVSQEDGAALHRRLEAGECTVRITADLFRGWARCPIVVADVPGGSRDFVLIHGHYDSWHEGIGDNAVGNAALLGVARAIHGIQNRLHRGVRIAWWPGHSTGRYAGSTWYADEFALELRDHCVAQIDVDSPGCIWATSYDEVMWMKEAEGIASRSIRDVTGIEPKGMRPLRAGDYSFNSIGLTGFYMLLSNIPAEVANEKGFYPVGGCGGNSNAWHTEGDTLEVADRDNLERDIRVYVDAVGRLATAPFLPFDYRAAVHEIATVSNGYAEAADGAFDVEPVEGECRALATDLDRFYAAAEELATATDGPTGAHLHERLVPYNRTQLRLARELVPINYSAAARFYHDPALETHAVPDLAILQRWPQVENDEDGRGFLINEARRGRNRIVDALRRAREHVAAVLED